jgi:hypothetical protein
MTEAMLAQELAQLKEGFGEIDLATGSAGQKLIRIRSARLAKGCSPAETPVLLVVRGDQPRPEIYVKPGIRLPNGREPRSTSLMQIEGESWLQFSYSFAYDPNVHTLAQFAAAALTRFKKDE